MSRHFHSWILPSFDGIPDTRDEIHRLREDAQEDYKRVTDLSRWHQSTPEQVDIWQAVHVSMLEEMAAVELLWLRYMQCFTNSATPKVKAAAYRFARKDWELARNRRLHKEAYAKTKGDQS